MSDPRTPSLELLLQRRDWVRALARGLVADEHLAEDLAQDAAVIAIEADERPAKPGPWLRGILRNLAANLRRRSARHTRAETRAARPEAVPSASESVAFVEQQRLLAEAVLGLDAPLRDVILLRFYDELPQREIAKQLEIPKATVNNRLTRALAKVRTRLDASHRGDRRAWVRALTPIGMRQGRLLLGFWIMKKSLIATAAVLIALLASGAWILSGSTGADAPPESEVPSPLVARLQASDEQTDRIDPMARTPVVREELDVPPLQILVVDKSTGLPVPEAEVRVLGRTAIPIQELERHGRESALRRADRRDYYMLGQLRTLDPEGILRLERPLGRGITVFASAGQRVGLLGLPADASFTSPVLLELWPLHRVRVRVVDELGNAVGAVAVETNPPGNPLVETTEADGYAETYWTHGYVPSNSHVPPWVCLAFPMVEMVVQQLSVTAEGPEEVTLLLPPAGRVRVQVTRDGVPVSDGTVVRLLHGRYGQPVLSPRAYYKPVPAQTRDSVAEFWPVGVGTDLEAWIQPENGDRRFSVTGPGPAAKGETVTLHLDVHARRIPIVGRIVAEGDPVVPDDLRVKVLVDGGEFFLDLELDGEGGFSHAFAFRAGTEDHGRIEVSAKGRRRVELPLPPPGEDGSMDLGELRLSASTAGVVVDADGKPVTEGDVSIGRPGTQLNTGWFPVGRNHELDGEGRFALWDETTEEDLWLHVEDTPELWYHEPVPWNRDASQIRLVLQPAGVLAARILLAPDVPRRRVSVVAWREPGPDGERRDRPRPPYAFNYVDGEGGIRFTSLPPGEYTFAVYIGLETHRPVVRLDGIQVAPGMVTEDRRLSPLDLRAAFRVIDLRLQDETGATVQGRATVYIEAPPRTRGIWSFPSLEAPIVVPRRDVLRRILIEAEGYFPITLGPEVESQEVIMSRGVPVIVSLREAPELQEPFSLAAVIEPLDAPARKTFSTRGPDSGDADVRGRVEMRVPEVGEYRLRVAVKHGPTRRYEEVTPVGLPNVVVRGPVTVDVALDPAVVQQAMLRMRDRR